MAAEQAEKKLPPAIGITMTRSVKITVNLQ